MKHLLLCVAFFFAFLSLPFAQVDILDIKENQTTSAEDTLQNSLLWQISGNGLETSSFLYGTIHIIPEKDFFITENTQRAIDESERITFEINMEKMNGLGMMFSMLSNAFMKDGQSLKKLLSEDEYKLVANHFEKIGLPLALFEKVKPMFTSMIASTDMSGGNPMEGQSGSVSYEQEFLEIAKKQKMKVEGLETIEYQMSMFDSIPYEMQAAMLLESVQMGSEDSTDINELDQMIEMYKAQDLNGLSSMISSEEGGMGEFEDILLVNRNKNWIPLMQKQMATKKTFFAVGAGHLGGQEGVIRLLRKEGYEVTPLLD